MPKEAIGIIDAQRGFMPAAEGDRLGMAGFGELAIAGGEQVVDVINQLLADGQARGRTLFTTQDWHPAQTAHFSATPNFTTTWPVHCVAATAGAELHPHIRLPAEAVRFYKGAEVLNDGADDTSYSAWYASTDGLSLPDFLRMRGIETIYLAGLAFDYCVGRTALDLAQRGGWQVVVFYDATRAVAEASDAAMQQALRDAGVLLKSTTAFFTR
jgi:nicotinamidase/pyrazinamidase